MDVHGQYTDLHDYFHFKEDLSCDLLKQLNSLRQESSLTDVLLCADGKEIPCHRSILASSSPYFKAMFCSNFKERLQSHVHLLGICVDVLNQIVDYVYTGEIIINGGNVLPLMEAADIYHYPKVLEACSLYLQNHLTPENCFSLAKLAEIFNCESLYKQARAVSLQNFSKVAASKDLKELSCSELAGYLGADELCAEEEQVFETLTDWINHDPKARQGCIHKLFQKVRLQYVHPTYLFHFMLNNPLIQSSPVCKSILESASRLLFSLSPADTPDIKSMWYVPRRFASQEFLIIVGGRKDNQQMRETLLYDQSSQQWLGLSKLPVRLYKASSVSLHSNVYVLGGLLINDKKRSLSASVYYFSLKMNAWRTAEDMLVPCYSHQSVAHKNYIFSLGGISSNQVMLNALQRYDSIFSIWEIMAPMPVAVLHPAVAAAKNQRLYVFGGEDIKQNPVRLIQVYNISRNMWFRMETRMVKNICAPAAVIGDNIIIVGGYTRRMISFDTKTSKFLKCAGMKERRMHHGATVINNKIYVTGGRYIATGNSIEDSDSFDCYDPETDTWTTTGSLPHKLFDHGCLTLQSVFYKPHTL